MKEDFSGFEIVKKSEFKCEYDYLPFESTIAPLYKLTVKNKFDEEHVLKVKLSTSVTKFKELLKNKGYHGKFTLFFN